MGVKDPYARVEDRRIILGGFRDEWKWQHPMSLRFLRICCDRQGHLGKNSGRISCPSFIPSLEGSFRIISPLEKTMQAKKCSV